MAKKREEKGACLSLSEIVYSSTLYQPRHLAAFSPAASVRDGEKGVNFPPSLIMNAMEKQMGQKHCGTKVNLSDTWWSRRDVTLPKGIALGVKVINFKRDSL